MDNHLERAREYIAIAESSDAKREAYQRAADEIIAWVHDDPTRSYRDVDRQIGKAEGYAGRLVRWRTNEAQAHHLPFGGMSERTRKDASTTKSTLRDADDETIGRIVDDLPPERRGVIAQRLLADPDARSAMVDSVDGAAAAEAMHSDLTTRRTPIKSAEDPLPSPPAFASSFWRAVNAIQAANTELERFGVRGLDARPETRAAAERMAAQAADIRDAVVDHVIANITTEGTP